MTIPISALAVQVSAHMVDQKRAVKIGDTVYVSPAMWDLMKHADQDELRHLLENIGLLDLGECGSTLYREFR